MPGSSKTILKAALRFLHLTRMDHLAGPLTNDVGVIFMLHRVTPEPAKEFEPNRILRVSPQFLETVVDEVIADGFDVIALDDLSDRLKSAKSHTRPFACFTFDDGYRDNREHAYPIFKKRSLPFAVYVPTEFADGTGNLWWLALEGAISRASQVTVQMEGGLKTFATNTPLEKDIAYGEIYWWLRKIPEDRARAVVADLATTAGFDAQSLCAELVMSWDEVREFAADPLVTIGAHTKGHYSLAKLPIKQAREQINDSIKELERQLGRPCHHFSYPYGSPTDAGNREFDIARELGIKTAVTTRKGLLQPSHVNDITALPRLSLNGDFQDIELIKTLLSGIPFALLNAVKTVTGTRATA